MRRSLKFARKCRNILKLTRLCCPKCRHHNNLDHPLWCMWLEMGRAALELVLATGLVVLGLVLGLALGLALE